MAQPKIEVNQITAAPDFEGSNITNVDAVSLNGVADTGYAKLASANTFTANQTIDASGSAGLLAIRGNNGTALQLENTTFGTNTWEITTLNDDLAFNELASSGGLLFSPAFKIESFGAVGRKELILTTGEDVTFGGKALNRANVFSTSNNVNLTLINASQYIRMTSGSSRTLTVPTNASVAFPIGTQVDIHRVSGAVTVAASGGVTVNTPETLNLRKPHSSASLIKVGTDEWDLVGDLQFL